LASELSKKEFTSETLSLRGEKAEERKNCGCKRRHRNKLFGDQSFTYSGYRKIVNSIIFGNTSALSGIS